MIRPVKFDPELVNRLYEEAEDRYDGPGSTLAEDLYVAAHALREQTVARCLFTLAKREGWVIDDRTWSALGDNARALWLERARTYLDSMGVAEW